MHAKTHLLACTVCNADYTQSDAGHVRHAASHLFLHVTQVQQPHRAAPRQQFLVPASYGNVHVVRRP
jgi:hypothetical protein